MIINWVWLYSCDLWPSPRSRDHWLSGYSILARSNSLRVCYSLQIFNFDDFCIFYEIFIHPITVFVYKNPEMTRERLELSYCLKIWFYCLILRYKAKMASWFGSVGRNRARKSPKNEIFWFGQKIWLGYPLGQPKIIKL